MPYFGSLVNSVKIGDVTYNTSLTVKRDGEANETTEADYPYTVVTDVNTIAKKCRWKYSKRFVWSLSEYDYKSTRNHQEGN